MYFAGSEQFFFAAEAHRVDNRGKRCAQPAVPAVGLRQPATAGKPAIAGHLKLDNPQSSMS